MSPRKRILIICDYYLPGFESGGAVRTLANMVDRLSDRFEFLLITRDHDGTANRTAYANINVGEWNDVGAAKVFYLSPEMTCIRKLQEIVNSIAADVVYLNSFFSKLTVEYLTLAKLGRVAKVPVILAPEGEFSPGALFLSATKKKLYMKTVWPLIRSDSLIWKAAADSERQEIEDILGDKHDVMVAPNMPPRMICPNFEIESKPNKTLGAARMIFLSRFMRKKNFNWLFAILPKVTGRLAINICGTLEEQDYWNECKRMTALLPSNVEITSTGPIPHQDVSETLLGHHFFILPTLGENFGHVFIEALAAGCPVITSDRTPWRGLEDLGVGWDISLNDPDRWLAAIDRCIALDDQEYRAHALAARTFAVDWLSAPEIERTNVEVIEAALRSQTA